MTNHSQEIVDNGNNATTAILIIGAIALIAIGIGTYVYFQKKQKEDENDISNLREKYMK